MEPTAHSSNHNPQVEQASQVRVTKRKRRPKPIRPANFRPEYDLLEEIANEPYCRKGIQSPNKEQQQMVAEAWQRVANRLEAKGFYPINIQEERKFFCSLYKVFKNCQKIGRHDWRWFRLFTDIQTRPRDSTFPGMHLFAHRDGDPKHSENHAPMEEDNATPPLEVASPDHSNEGEAVIQEERFPASSVLDIIGTGNFSIGEPSSVTTITTTTPMTTTTSTSCTNLRESINLPPKHAPVTDREPSVSPTRQSSTPEASVANTSSARDGVSTIVLPTPHATYDSHHKAEFQIHRNLTSATQENFQLRGALQLIGLKAEVNGLKWGLTIQSFGEEERRIMNVGFRLHDELPSKIEKERDLLLLSFPDEGPCSCTNDPHMAVGRAIMSAGSQLVWKCGTSTLRLISLPKKSSTLTPAQRGIPVQTPGPACQSQHPVVIDLDSSPVQHQRSTLPKQPPSCGRGRGCASTPKEDGQSQVRRSVRPVKASDRLNL